jgi:lycopene beta-cyclase
MYDSTFEDPAAPDGRGDGVGPTGFDLIIVGAGLAAATLVLRLARLPTPPRVLILEAGGLAFGDKTWSFQCTDLQEGDDLWLSPAIAASWPRQSVRFESLQREIETGYASLTSATVRRAVADCATVEVRTQARVLRIDAQAVLLESGARVTAPCVIDASGHVPDPGMVLAYQKFVGLRVRTKQPHGITAPVIMDASVQQIDGFRFIYLLPFAPDEVLIEDTRYADGAALDEPAIEAEIKAYAAARGWQIASLEQRETGVLPITLAFERRQFWSGSGDVPLLGMRAALFHSTTGYSLADSVRAANLVADAWPVESAALADIIRTHARRRAPRQAFYRLLNRMLFRAAAPDQRHLVMQKFYRLPRPLIERFYAGSTTVWDVMRILSGKPPVPIHRALPCIFETAVPRIAPDGQKAAT